MTRQLTSLAALALIWSAIVTAGCRPQAPVADWRYTRWYTTVDEVRAASHGAATPADPSDQPHDRSRDNQVLLKAPVSWQGMSFMAYFAFDRRTARLVSVTLELQGANADLDERLLGLLTKLYGAPYSGHQDPSTRILVWDAADESVAYVKVSDPRLAVGAPATSVSYQPSGPPK